jgi:hypothetical protein
MNSTLIRTKVQEIKDTERQAWWIEMLFGLATFAMLVCHMAWVFAAWVVKTIYRKATDRQEQAQKAAPRFGVNQVGDFKPTIWMPYNPVQKSDFVAADRIITVELEPDIGRMHFRLYAEQGRVSRDMVLTLGKLTSLLKTSRLSLVDVPYKPGDDLDKVIDQATQDFGKKISQMGSEMQLKRVKPKKVAEPVKKSVVAPVETKRLTAVVPKAAPAAEVQMPRKPVQPHKPVDGSDKVSNYLRPGMTYEGILADARTETVTPIDGRKPYNTFVATINTEYGRIPVRGNELDREIQAQGARIGDRISITHLGKVPVDLPNGETGKKNMYQVNILERN